MAIIPGLPIRGDQLHTALTEINDEVVLHSADLAALQIFAPLLQITTDSQGAEAHLG